jgi:hypothetical protein
MFSIQTHNQSLRLTSLHTRIHIHIHIYRYHGLMFSIQTHNQSLRLTSLHTACANKTVRELYSKSYVCMYVCMYVLCVWELLGAVQ